MLFLVAKRMHSALMEDAPGDGCSLENASFGLTVCAERNAVAAAVAGGARRVTAVLVVTGARPAASPCGACRQVLAEFAAPDTAVWLVSAAPGAARPAPECVTMGDLLPRSFRFAAPRSGSKKDRAGQQQHRK